VPIGGVLTLNLTVTNRGPSAAYNLVVTQGFSLSATSLLAGAASGTITTTTSLLTWTLSTLATNASASCSVTVRVAQAGTLMTRAAVTHPANDPALVNNLDWEIVTVGPSNAVRMLPLMANELVFDSMRSRIYASVPASESFLGNSVAALDADTGELLDAWFVGSQPNQIALSDDGHFLHVGLDGRMSARHIDLTAGLAGLEFPFSTGLTTATDLEVQPGHPEVVAAALLTPNNAYPVAVRLYDCGVWRSNGPAGPLTRFLEFSPDGQKIYGAVPSGQGFGFVRYNVAADGLYPLPVDQNFSGDDEFEQDNGLIYRQSGQVIDPNAMTLLGTYPTSGPVLPDSAVGRVYFLAPGGSGWELRAYEQGTFLALGVTPIPGVQGTPSSLIHGGRDRIAFRTSANQFVLARTALAAHDAPANLVVRGSVSPSAAVLGNAFTYSLSVSNAGPNPAANVVARAALPGLVGLVSASASQGSNSFDGTYLSYAVGTLASGQQAILSITVTGAAPGSVTNRVQAFATAVDLNPADNAIELVSEVTLPVMNIGDVTLLEGNSGFKNAAFIVSLSAPIPRVVTVNFATSNGTAITVFDYQAVSGTLTIPAGATNASIIVPILGDTTVEPAETFFVNLSNPTFANLGRAQGLGTILNDDALASGVSYFTWGTVAPTKLVNLSFAAAITARDAQGGVATNFNGAVTLATLAPPVPLTNGNFETGSLAPWTPVNAGTDPGPYQIVSLDVPGRGTNSLAFRLTPNSGSPDGLRQRVPLTAGTPYLFDLDIAQSLDANDPYFNNGGETEIRIFVAGTEVAGFNFIQFGVIVPGQIMRTNLHGVFTPQTNGVHEIQIAIYRNWGPSGYLWGNVDNFRVAPGTFPPPSPGFTLDFTNGVWAGKISLTNPASGVFLRADDGQGHTGDSAMFSVIGVPVIRALVGTNGIFQFRFFSLSNRTYQVQYSSNLVQWISVTPLLNGTGGELPWTDSGPPQTDSPPLNTPRRFYRVILRP